MLEITCRKEFDIFQIILVIAKYNLQTSLSTQTIRIENADIPTDVLYNINSIIQKYVVRNYSSTEVPQEISEPHTDIKIEGKVENSFTKYNSTIPGEVYYCDFGIPFEHEIGYKRPAIVLWNFSNQSLVLPCTSNNSEYDGKFKISLKKENFKNCERIMSSEDSMGMIAQLRVIDNSRLQERIGILSDNIFSEIKMNLRSYFSFSITGLPFPQLEIMQMHFDELKEIVFSIDTKETKIDKLLALYGFNYDTKGVLYLKEAILCALNLETFNIGILSERIAVMSNLDAKEVERLIVARFKEVFNKSYKTIDFIRLIKTILMEVSV